MYVLYAIRCTLHAIRDACSYTQYEIRSTNSYVRNYKKKMQNKANFQKSQINVSDLLTMNYVKMDTWSSGKNKANSKPIQTQYKANSNPIQSQFKPNTNPIQTQYKPNTNPIQSQDKPNSNPIQTQYKPNQSQFPKGKKCCRF